MTTMALQDLFYWKNEKKIEHSLINTISLSGTKFTTNERALCNDLYKKIQRYGKLTLKIECIFLSSKTADYLKIYQSMVCA